MNPTLAAALTKIQSAVGGMIAFGFGAADLWKFHSLAQSTDLVFVVGGLGALGVVTAYHAGLGSDPTTPLSMVAAQIGHVEPPAA